MIITSNLPANQVLQIYIKYISGKITILFETANNFINGVHLTTNNCRFNDEYDDFAYCHSSKEPVTILETLANGMQMV